MASVLLAHHDVVTASVDQDKESLCIRRHVVECAGIPENVCSEIDALNPFNLRFRAVQDDKDTNEHGLWHETCPLTSA